MSDGYDELSSLLRGSASEVAPRLLGCLLERTIEGQRIQVRIVETEAYDQTDVASHSYRGMTPRTEIMFGGPGYLYVYFTYGMHYCCNIVVGEPGYGAAVLLRAVEPLLGEQYMQLRRGGKSGIELSNGPAKLCQALNIDKALNRHDLRDNPLQLISRPALPKKAVVSATRIGISRGKEALWRFYERDNPYVSHT